MGHNSHFKMKVFATLATLLGASSATPLIPSDMRMNQMSLRSDNVMRPSMQMSMDEVNRRPIDMRRKMSNQMSYQMPNQMSNQMLNQMSNQMSNQMPNMRDIYSDSQQAFGPNQYFLKDTFGNYVYGYSDVNSEKKEESNGQSVKGAYAYIMSNGIKRRVDYIADDQGFHIIRDNADSSRIKRSVEPDLINTRMTSFMDSSSLRDDGRDMYIMDRNVMDHNMMGRNMMRNGMMGRRNMYNINQDSGIMRQQMYRNMMGDMSSTNMMRQGSDMMGRMNAYTTTTQGGLLGRQQQVMSQKMEMERIPEETFISTRFF